MGILAIPGRRGAKGGRGGLDLWDSLVSLVVMVQVGCCSYALHFGSRLYVPHMHVVLLLCALCVVVTGCNYFGSLIQTGPKSQRSIKE